MLRASPHPLRIAGYAIVVIFERALLGGDVAPAVIARSGLSRDVAERDVAGDRFGVAGARRAEAAAARGLEADDVAAPEAEIADFRAQRRLDAVADEDQPSGRRRAAAGQPIGAEAEALEIGGEDRLGGIDAPFAIEAEPAAMRAGARRIRQEPVAQDGERRVALDHLDRNVGVVVHAARIGAGAVLERMAAGAADLDLDEDAAVAIGRHRLQGADIGYA